MTPLLLLPGMMCDARLFGPQVDALSAHHPIVTVPLNAHDTMEAMAREILSYAPPIFALAGLSLGGIVAMEVLRQAPQRVERLALLDTNPLSEAPERQANRGPQINDVKAGNLRRVMRDEMKPNYLTDGPNRQTILDLCMDMAMGLGPNVFENQSLALRDRPDQTETLRAFKGPSLVLCGRDDALCPIERHELMHALLSNSTLTVIENAGHMPTLENPTDTTAALARWLEAS
ncbi:alpha/beta fold hydrolase [Hoeflea sp. TYP-13]|uniref:alpha/beta fold hydrolase n=1 Tax=Hoeflea sp. TYP-13 TaxID=3230023 RepID=UPI0034C610A9